MALRRRWPRNCIVNESFLVEFYGTIEVSLEKYFGIDHANKFYYKSIILTIVQLKY